MCVWQLQQAVAAWQPNGKVVFTDKKLGPDWLPNDGKVQFCGWHMGQNLYEQWKDYPEVWQNCSSSVMV